MLILTIFIKKNKFNLLGQPNLFAPMKNNDSIRFLIDFKTTNLSKFDFIRIVPPFHVRVLVDWKIKKRNRLIHIWFCFFSSLFCWNINYIKYHKFLLKFIDSFIKSCSYGTECPYYHKTLSTKTVQRVWF